MQRRIALVLLIAAVLCGTAGAQGVITTFAGTDWVFPGDGKPAINAPLGVVSGITVDQSGNVIVVDSDNCIVARITSGMLRVIGGTSICTVSGDNGPATSASIQRPNSVALDQQGNLYLTTFSQIKRVSAAGILTTLAGHPNLAQTGGFLGDDGPAVDAAMNPGLGGIVVNKSGDVFFGDANNNKVRKIDQNGIISTAAGSGGNPITPGPAQGIALQTRISVQGITLDSSGNLYIADPAFNTIRRVADGIITTAVSNVAGAVSVAFDQGNTMYVGGRSAVYKISAGSSDPIIIAGSEQRQGFSGDGGLATAALFSGPLIVAHDNAGNLYVCDKGNFRVRKIDRNGIITTIAGNGRFRYGGEGLPALAVALNGVSSVALDPAGNLYFSESRGHRVRKVASGIVTTYAGTGGAGLSGDDGPATQAALNSPTGLAIDGAGNLVIADNGNNRLRKVTPDGTISTFASAFDCRALAFNSAGILYAACNNAVLKINVEGNLTSVAGTISSGFSGDGGPAASALLNRPSALAFDGAGNLYIVDSSNQRVRKVTPQGMISTVAGTGSFICDFLTCSAAPPFQEGGEAAKMDIGNPTALAFDSAGNLYISTILGVVPRILKLIPSGIVSTFAGGGPSGELGDGKVATAAAIAGFGLAFDGTGNLYIADTSRIRKILAQPPAIQTSVQSLSFSGMSDGAPTRKQNFSIIASVPGLGFSISTQASWLRLSVQSGATPALIEVHADPTDLPPGVHSSTITITAPDATPSSVAISVNFAVAPGVGPVLALDKLSLSFPFPRAGRARNQTLTVSNVGGGTLNFTATTSTRIGGNWLSVAPASGKARPALPTILTVMTDPQGLPAGTYNGQIVVSSDAGNQTAPVTMTISALDTATLLTQTGLSFTAVAGGGVVPSQPFGILNIGNGVMPWTVSTSTLSGGSAWLKTSVTQGATNASSSTVPTLEVQVNPAGLAPGRYYGLVRVDAPGAANTPQALTAFLEVLPPDADPGSVVQPTELVFNAVAAAGSPGSKDVLVYNLTSNPLTFRSNASADRGSVAHLPRDGTVQPQTPTRIVVQPITGELPPGTYGGSLTLQFSDGTVRSVNLMLIVSAPGATPGTLQTKSAFGQADGCAPTKLLPAFLSLGQSSSVPAGWPAGLVIEVKDDCGQPMTSGAVVVSFSNGDLPVPLNSLKNGRWHGTWQNRNANFQQITLKADAQQFEPRIQGSREVSADLRAAQDPPLIETESVVSTASPAPHVPLAPGSLISIYGERLSEAEETAKAAPLPNTLGGAQVFMAGRELPLLYAGQKQINAIVPYGLETNTTHQILVRRGFTYSRPVPVNVAVAQPAIFANAITAVRRDGDEIKPFLVSAGNPAMTGDTLVVYCAGLGAVDPPISTGAMSPVTPPAATRELVRLRIGDRESRVTFAGLTPSFVGLYQVNAVVPEGVPRGTDVPLTIEIGGQTSPPAALAIR